MIEIANITKEYKMGEGSLQILKGVSLRVEDGDFVAIMGPSGSGKSTLMNILGLLDVPTSGSYRWNDKEVSQLTEDELAVFRRKEVGFIFQQFHLLPRLSAVDNVALPLLYSQTTRDLQKPGELLERVGLGSRKHHRPNELSGGQQQRVAIARSLVNQPNMILADEPTGNLDSVSEKEIMTALRELNAQGMTVVLVTHEEEIGAQAHRLIRMRDGLIQSDERRVPLGEVPALPPAVEGENKSSLWLEIWAHFKQGLVTLFANKVRTGLSMLGILIGVAAVVAMLAIGKGAQESIESQLSALGSNLLMVQPGAVRVGGVAKDEGNTARLTPEDGVAIHDRLMHVVDVSSSVVGQAQITFEDHNWSTQAEGATANFASMHASIPVTGRFFTTAEVNQRARVTVLGATVVREIFGDRNPLGETVKLNKIPFMVIGVLPAKGANAWHDQDNVAVIPVTTAMHRLLGRVFVDYLEVQVDHPEEIPGVRQNIIDLMLGRHHMPQSMGEDAFIVRNMADIQAALAQSSATMSLLLASIAAISLLVGGIGIMNIMLVSVTERTKEIGLRKAIGARKRDILLQFLIESIVVSAVGGILGICLGWGVTEILGALAGWATSVSPQSVGLAFMFSAVIGVVFGVYPARKASKLHPIEALRYE